MLNLHIGSAKEIDGKTCILTSAGSAGHAVYGPYMSLDPGRYVVEFNLSAAEDLQIQDSDVCAVVDVAADLGRLILASEQVRFADLQNGPLAIALTFQVDAPRTCEFRVGVTGQMPLVIEDYCRVLPLDAPNVDYAQLLDATRFPDPSAAGTPAFFCQHLANLRKIYEGGATISFAGNDVIIKIDEVSFYARVSDDLRFVGEIFFRNAYNFLFQKECCVIDIGMNIGLVALSFARKNMVKEVHSFEPFKETYERALANISLNPEISNKISAKNFGLAGENRESTILINDKSDSGLLSIRGSGYGEPEHISIRDAAKELRPIIEAAKSNGLDIIAKVDCEGSEFPVFQSLEKDNLLEEISVFMVEWHRVLEGKSQRDLVAPLLQRGFVIFDLTTKSGNGFFYAVRATR